jgi:putative hydrolase of the HAD superfamily
LIQNELEELEVFIKFYNIIFKELKDFEIDSNIVENIARDTVYNDEKFVFYDDVFEVIPLLSKDYKLGIVSDTWPSLKEYLCKGLRNTSQPLLCHQS